MVSQGEVYWLDEAEPSGSEPGWRRPGIVVQNDALNESRLGTVLLVLLTSNLKRESALGNVRIPAREAGLAIDSVALVAQLVTVDRRFLGEAVGNVGRQRLRQIVRGIALILEPVTL